MENTNEIAMNENPHIVTLDSPVQRGEQKNLKR